MIRRLAEALAGWQDRDNEAERAAVDQALQSATGLSLDTLDALPAQALLAMARRSVGDGLVEQRIRAMVEALEAWTAIDPEGAPARQEKATALREIIH
ncbi:MAG: hypothetical protein AAGA48_17995 [Myxococcota bacterium]